MPTTAVALFVAALIAGTVASGGWCAAAAVRRPSLAHRAWIVAVIPLCAVAALGAVLRFRLLPPHHAMYLDEPWYAEAACSLARGQRLALCTQTWSGMSCEPYGKAMGWPVAMALWALLAGCGSSIGIALNRVLGTATIFLAAAAARAAGARWWQALIAAGILAIHPTHVAWSATGETNVPAAAALLAGLCGALQYLRRGAASGAALATSALGLATAMRPESLLAALIAASVIAAAAKTAPRRRGRVAAAIAIVAAAAALSALPLWTMNASISGGAFLSVLNVAPRLAGSAGGPLLRVHGLVLVVALIGAIALARRERAAAALLLVTGLAMGLVVLAYDRFDERMLLGATVALVPLAACALDWRTVGDGRGVVIAAVAVGVVGALWRAPLRARADVPETQLLETRLAIRAGATPIATGGLIIAPQPPVLAAAGMAPPMSTTEALAGDDRLARTVASGQPVYFLCDMFCETDFPVGGAAQACEEIFSRFAVAPVTEETVPGRTYGLYRLSLPRPADAVAPPCPRPRPPTAPP